MACRKPLIAWQHKFFKTKKGKKVIVFNDKKRQEKDRDIRNWEQIEIPCGQCIDCRLRRRQEWRIRLYNELPKHKYAYFITLTYNDEHVPRSTKNPEITSLRKSDVQKFFKRWRKGKAGYKAEKLVYFYCGEYGSQTFRSHYHIIAFTDNPIPDLKYWSKSKGLPTWRSEKIESIWSDENNKPIGNVLIGTVTFDSCGYVARYITKKELGKSNIIYKELGIQEPYINMSNGIGKLSVDEMLKFYINDETMILKGDTLKKYKPGSFYDKQLSEIDPKWHDLIKENRKANAIAERKSNLYKTGLTADEYRENQARKKDKKYVNFERDI